MGKKTAKSKKHRPLPKSNQQIPNSLVRKSTFSGPGQLLEHARDYPIYGCWIMADWQAEGIAPVVIAREQEAGRVMFGVYLVDLYCLGIKDVFIRTDYSANHFERDLPAFCAGDPQKCSVELAHEVIYGALEYAQSLGFQPHADFSRQMADRFLDPPDAHPRLDHVPFGKDGKPFYVAGPNDGEYKTRQVINTLLRTRGEGNFDYMVGLGGMLD